MNIEINFKINFQCEVALQRCSLGLEVPQNMNNDVDLGLDKKVSSFSRR